MPTFRRYQIPKDTPPEIPAPGCVPLQATNDQVANAAMHGLDSLLGSGSRVLFEYGLHGGAKAGSCFLVPDGADPDYPAGARLYPDASTGRVVGRGVNVAITPGYFLGLDVVALPSGPTQLLTIGLLYENSGTFGSFVLEVTYTNGDAETAGATATIEIPGSVELYAGEPSPAHAHLFTGSATAGPWLAVPDSELEERFGRGNDVVATWTLTAYGSPRPVDVAVVEKPNAITVDVASSRWPTAMYTDAGQPLDAVPSGGFPVEQIATADPGGGTNAIGRALREHGRQLGPVLAFWGSGDEHSRTLADWVSYDGGIGDDESPPITGSSVSPVHVPFGLGSNPSLPGFLLGHYARQVEHGEDFLDGRTGVLPVVVAVYIKSTDAIATFHSTLADDGWSAIRIPAISGVWGWEIASGWLEVGAGVEDSPPGRLFIESPGGAAWSVRYCAVFMQVRT